MKKRIKKFLLIYFVQLLILAKTPMKFFNVLVVKLIDTKDLKYHG